MKEIKPYNHSIEKTIIMQTVWIVWASDHVDSVWATEALARKKLSEIINPKYPDLYGVWEETVLQ